MKRHGWIILVAVVVAVGAGIDFVLNRNGQVQHFTAKVDRGEIHDSVEATGTINAVITVQVGSQVSGTIPKLNADFNSRVRKGDVVALIDPALFKGALLQATADLENARANLVAAKRTWRKRKRGWCRRGPTTTGAVGSFKSGMMSQQQLDLAKANYDSAEAA